MKKFNYLILLLIFLSFSCKKEQLLYSSYGKTLQLEIKGYVVTDTLEFVKDNEVICTASGQSFKMKGNLYFANSGFINIQIRKKGDSKIIGNFQFTDKPYYQLKKIFYDGTTISDNVERTAVSNPENMGIRVRFSSTFSNFYGGPVDIQLFVETQIDEPYSKTVTPIKMFRNVTGTFSEFAELPPLAIDTVTGKKYAYTYKVYKAGTTEPPYNNLDSSNSIVEDFDTNYGYEGLDYFKSGDSRLLSISPLLSDIGTGKLVLDVGYVVVDYSSAFK